MGAEDEKVENLVPHALHHIQYPQFAPANIEAALYDVATDGVIDLACSTPTADVGACG